MILKHRFNSFRDRGGPYFIVKFPISGAQVTNQARPGPRCYITRATHVYTRAVRGVT